MSLDWINCARCGRRSTYRRDRTVDGRWTCRGCIPHARPIIGDDRWQERAACRDHPTPDDFYDIGTGLYPKDNAARALAVCARCDVRTECLDAALTQTEQWGIWGGFLPDERRQLKRARSRGNA